MSREKMARHFAETQLNSMKEFMEEAPAAVESSGGSPKQRAVRQMKLSEYPFAMIRFNAAACFRLRGDHLDSEGRAGVLANGPAHDQLGLALRAKPFAAFSRELDPEVLYLLQSVLVISRPGGNNENVFPTLVGGRPDKSSGHGFLRRILPPEVASPQSLENLVFKCLLVCMVGNVEALYYWSTLEKIDGQLPNLSHARRFIAYVKKTCDNQSDSAKGWYMQKYNVPDKLHKGSTLVPILTSVADNISGVVAQLWGSSDGAGKRRGEAAPVSFLACRQALEHLLFLSINQKDSKHVSLICSQATSNLYLATAGLVSKPHASEIHCGYGAEQGRRLFGGMKLQAFLDGAVGVIEELGKKAEEEAFVAGREFGVIQLTEHFLGGLGLDTGLGGVVRSLLTGSPLSVISSDQGGCKVEKVAVQTSAVRGHNNPSPACAYLHSLKNQDEIYKWLPLDGIIFCILEGYMQTAFDDQGSPKLPMVDAMTLKIEEWNGGKNEIPGNPQLIRWISEKGCQEGSNEATGTAAQPEAREDNPQEAMAPKHVPSRPKKKRKKVSENKLLCPWPEADIN